MRNIKEAMSIFKLKNLNIIQNKFRYIHVFNFWLLFWNHCWFYLQIDSYWSKIVTQLKTWKNTYVNTESAHTWMKNLYLHILNTSEFTIRVHMFEYYSHIFVSYCSMNISRLCQLLHTECVSELPIIYYYCM